ncbi:ParB N-terminal domain-containing protein [Marinobacter halodurans]
MLIDLVSIDNSTPDPFSQVAYDSARSTAEIAATGLTGVDYSNSDGKLVQQAADWVANGLKGGENLVEWAVTGECTHCGPLMATESAGTPAVAATTKPAAMAIPLGKEAETADWLKKLTQLRASMAASGASSSYLSGLDQQIDEELSSLQQMTGKPLALDHGRLVNPAIGDRERQLANGTSVTPVARPMAPSTGGSEVVDSGLGLLTRPAEEGKAWSTVSEDRSDQVILGPYLMEQGGGVAEKVDSNDLIPTQPLTKSRKQMKRLSNEIDEAGEITESLKYVERDGKKYLVDGHHRHALARQKGIDQVPAEKVELPYKGYKTEADLEYSQY